MAEANSREARRRRRRILEQGSDRLAFITGRIQTLHPDTAPPPIVLPQGEVEEDSNSNSVLKNHDHDASRSSVTQTPPLHNNNNNNNNKQEEGESEISSVPTPEIEPEQVQAQAATPPDSSLEFSQQHPRERESFIIPSDVSSAINASRVTRLYCSVIVALLVVASYLLGTHLIKSVISFRPLYLVLLTNSTLVAARLVSGSRSKRRRQNSTTSSSEWDAQLARTLELGMVLQNVVDAVFIDCAVYAIVLICGLSLVHA